jgi:excinuclease UvrABC ATPase subunit
VSTDTPPAARHVADSHDLIRVHGARENNLKDVSVELPKRRLTVFTGVSGSGKSSLVFDTIAAESQRLINETYSAFVQGFMPTLARPEVDVLEGLTTAISVDQERMGANVRSTVGTATDANAMLRILFSRLGEPHIGSANAFSFNVPSVRGQGAITIERGAGETERRSFSVSGGMCPRCEGMGSVTDIDPAQLYDERRSLAEGAITIPGYKADGWSVRLFTESGFLDPDKPIRDYTETELHDFLRREPTKVKINGINLTYEGLIPRVQKSFLSRTGRRCSRTSAPSWTGRSPSPPAPSAAAPGSTRPPGRRGSGASTSPTSARCRSATWPNGSAAWTSRRWRRCWPRCSRPSTRSWRSGSATSRWTGRRGRCRAARHSAPR